MKTYTVSNIANMLNISIETVRRYVKTGKLKASRIAGQWRINDDDFKDFFEKNSNSNMVEGKNGFLIHKDRLKKQA